MDVVLIAPHQGLGDHILCNGLYRQIASNHRSVLILVKLKYRKELRRMLDDVNNLWLISMPNYKSWKTTKIIKFFAKVIGIKVIGLGSYGKNFHIQGYRFDHNFYNQAEIDFKLRWSNFNVSRDFEKENFVYNFYKCYESPYIFLHEDISRNFRINRNLIHGNFRIIEPNIDNKFSLFDYRKILENSVEVHVIESSFAAFVESLDLKVPIYAHRYARGHALYDFRHEFTYVKPWKVLY